MAAAESPVVTAESIRISEAPIRWGHVFWEDDISPMLAVLKELDDTREELQSYGSILHSLQAGKTAKQAGFYLVAVYDENSAETRKELSALADEIITDWSAAAAALEKAP